MSRIRIRKQTSKKCLIELHRLIHKLHDALQPHTKLKDQSTGQVEQIHMDNPIFRTIFFGSGEIPVFAVVRAKSSSHSFSEL
jgi:hypothetical protein